MDLISNKNVYSLSTAIKSEDAYSVLQKIGVKENEGNYAAQIARELDKNQNHIHNLMRPMKEQGILRESKENRDRAKYYLIDYDSLADIFCYLWMKELDIKPDISLNGLKSWDVPEEIGGSIQEAFVDNMIAKMKYDGLKSNGIEDIAALTYDFFKDYAHFYFFNNENSTIRTMMIDDFYLGIRMAEAYDREIPRFLEEFTKMAVAADIDNPGRSIVDALSKTSYSNT